MVEISVDTFKAFIKFIKNVSHNYEDFVIKNGKFSIVDNCGSCILIGKFAEEFSITLSNIKSKSNILATMLGSTNEKIQILLNGDPTLTEDNDDIMFYTIKSENKEIVIRKPNIIMNREVEIDYNSIISNSITKLTLNTNDFVKAINILSSKFKNDFFTIDLSTNTPKLVFEDTNASVSITLTADYEGDYRNSGITHLNVYNSFDIVSMTSNDTVDIIISPKDQLYYVTIDCNYKSGDNDLINYKVVGIGSTDNSN